MGATEVMYSDRHAYTVVEVVSARKIVVQADTATRTDNNGMSESQSYTYTPNPEGEKRTLSLRKDGRWVEVAGRQGFAIGTRREYHDYSF